MDEKDSMTPDTIPQSTPVDGTVPAGRKNRRTVVIGVAAVAAVALVAGGVWIQGVREPSGVDGAPGVPVGRHGPEQGREIV